MFLMEGKDYYYFYYYYYHHHHHHQYVQFIPYTWSTSDQNTCCIEFLWKFAVSKSTVLNLTDGS